MQSGLINKVEITPANVTDANGLEKVCPEQGAIYADKGYCGKNCEEVAAANNCHLAAIKKNNMIGKNKEKDRWYSKIRAPYERVFSKDNKRARYVGKNKNQFATLMSAMCFNLKRLVVLNAPDLCLT